MKIILYIFTKLEFPTHNSDFHLLTTSVNAKYYSIYIYIYSAKLPLLYISGTLRQHQFITLQHPLFTSTLQNLPLCYIYTLQNLLLCNISALQNLPQCNISTLQNLPVYNICTLQNLALCNISTLQNLPLM